ncbi:ArdC family protein [Geodermatophilus sp. SYSU D00691]
MTTRSRRPLTEDETRQRREAKRERLAALHERFTAQLAELTEGDQWRAMLEVAARFHRYSFRNVLLIHAQRPDATRVAGYRTWQAFGRQVRRGERGIQILAPVTYGVRGDEKRGEATPETDDRRRQVRSFTVEHVWDVSQTDGEPLPDVRPVFLEGHGVSRLWEATGERVRAAGYELKRGRRTNAAANGETDPKTRTVTVRLDLRDRQALKTQPHELAHTELGHVDDVLSYVTCRGRCEVEPRPKGLRTGDRPTCSQRQSSARGPRAVQLHRLHTRMCQDAAARQQECPLRSHRPQPYQDRNRSHLLHLGSRDSLWRVTAGCCARSSSWETAEARTGLGARSGSSDGASRHSARQRRRPNCRSPAPASKDETAGRRRRPAGGAVSRSLRAAGGRSPSGAPQPAGTGLGSRPGPLPPVCLQWSS